MTWAIILFILVLLTVCYIYSSDMKIFKKVMKYYDDKEKELEKQEQELKNRKLK